MNSKAGKLRRQLTNCSIKSVPTDEIDYYTVIEIKNHVLKLSKENEDAFDKADIQKYVNDSSYLRRFIIKGPIEESKKFVINILHWRKETGLNKLSINSFPKELFNFDFFTIVTNELDGHFCAIIRSQYFIRGQYMREMVNLFVCYMCYFINDLIVQKGDSFSMSIIFESTNLSLSQYDMDFMLFIIDFVTNKMPNNLKKVYLYNMPWYCGPLLKTILLFVPEQWRKLIVHVNAKTLPKFVAKESLPKFFKISTRTKPIEKVHTTEDKNVKNLKDLTEEELNAIGMKKENMKEYESIVNQWVEIEKKLKAV